MINENENEAENDKHIKQICGINRSRSRHGHKYTKYKMSQCNDCYVC